MWGVYFGGKALLFLAIAAVCTLLSLIRGDMEDASHGLLVIGISVVLTLGNILLGRLFNRNKDEGAS